MPAADSARSIERTNLLLWAGGSLGLFLAKGFYVMWSFALGSLLTALNFRLLRWISQSLLGVTSVSKNRLVLQIVLKLTAMIGLLALILFVLHPHLVYFALGFSTLVLAIAFEGVLGLFRGEKA